MNESAPDAAPAERSKPATGWRFGAFREWRAREQPRTAYRLAASVWRPEQCEQFAGEPEFERRMLKGSEPRLAGMAYNERNVFLVNVARELTAEHVGRLVFLVDLFRRDPDYGEHRGKRVRMVMIVREATPSLIDFARRRRIRVVMLDAIAAADGTAGPAGMNHAALMNR